MTVVIILAVFVGILVGYSIYPGEWYFATEYIMDIGICLLLLFVGIDIGKQKTIIKDIKKMGIAIIMVPFMVAIGSIVGAMLAGALLNIPFNEAGAVGAGFGWYSLSAIILADYSSELSALAFLTNVMREVIAIISIPLIAKFVGYMEVVAPGGATAMDTTLPMITKYSNSRISVLAFISGVILSTLVPIIVPIIISL